MFDFCIHCGGDRDIDAVWCSACTADGHRAAQRALSWKKAKRRAAEVTEYYEHETLDIMRRFS